MRSGVRRRAQDRFVGCGRAIEDAPHASAALLQIAYAQEEAGKKEDAIKTLKLICDKYPKTGEGSTAHTRLNDVYKIPVTLGGAKD